jgi:hypothetical protein
MSDIASSIVTTSSAHVYEGAPVTADVLFTESGSRFMRLRVGGFGPSIEVITYEPSVMRRIAAACADVASVFEEADAPEF